MCRSEIEDRVAKERQERNNAASLKETEMKQDAEASLAKFHADRKAANAAAEMSNQAEEKAAAEALANETNAWNTVYGMVDGQLATYAGASPSHHDLLKSLGQKGK